MKINPNIHRQPDGSMIFEIPFEFPICITQFRDLEEAKNFFEIRSGFIPGHPELYGAYYSAYMILAEAELYSAELQYLCQIDKRLLMQFKFPNFATAEHFYEELIKIWSQTTEDFFDKSSSVVFYFLLYSLFISAPRNII